MNHVRNHDIDEDRSIVPLTVTDYKLIRPGDYVDILSKNKKAVEMCVRVATVYPLAGQTRVMRSRSREPINLEEYLKAGRLALCSLYGKRLARVINKVRVS